MIVGYGFDIFSNIFCNGFLHFNLKLAPDQLFPLTEMLQSSKKKNLYSNGTHKAMFNKQTNRKINYQNQ